MEAVGHENEVVTLLLTNGDGISMQVFGEAFQQSGAEDLCFAPEAGQAVPLQLDSWPTLGEIIGTGKRLVVFMGTCGLPYLLHRSSPLFSTSQLVEELAKMARPQPH
jgi:hypothetical protein